MLEMPGGPMPCGSMMLITASRKRRIVIPRSLANFGECLRELQQIGIPLLPPFRWPVWQIAAGETVIVTLA
jgi:hypothetical protein